MTERGGEPGSDPISEFQRRLMRAGARGVAREVADKVRNTLGTTNSRSDVWETATGEQAGDEAPECAWCPICRAARMLRVSGPGIGSHLADVGDTLAGMAQDAMSVFEAAIKAQQAAGNRPPPGDNRSPSANRTPSANGTPAAGGTGAATAQAGGASSDDGPVVGTGTAGRPPVHAEHEHGEAADERGDRAERRDPGYRPADGGGDEQISGAAE